MTITTTNDTSINKSFSKMRGFFLSPPIIIIRLNKKLGLHVVIRDFREIEGLSVCEMKDGFNAKSRIILLKSEVLRLFGFFIAFASMQPEYKVKRE